MKRANDFLSEGAKTFAERNRQYGDNWRDVGAVLAALHPDGRALEKAEDFELWHLWELIAVKLTRFANSNFKHRDSIHDAMVYCAMIEAIVVERTPAPQPAAKVPLATLHARELSRAPMNVRINKYDPKETLRSAIARLHGLPVAMETKEPMLSELHLLQEILEGNIKINEATKEK